MAGSQPTTWSLSLNPTTGVLSGVPVNDTGSPFAFTVRASNGIGIVDQLFTLSVTPAGAYPAFTTQPVSVSTSIGQPVTFTVVATGSPVPTLQWQRQPSSGGGFVNIPEGNGYSGTTTGTLTIANATTGMNGDQYQCVASNVVNSQANSAPSNIATLTVSVGTIITTIAGTPGQTGTLDG
ncbi:MAG: immunoglobulin domain-containing protein, partial [Verrucomicrobia bacterium]|nr:immunoglobulin domain-containing protein [Verrucomicrobiota bacterium]